MTRKYEIGSLSKGTHPYELDELFRRQPLGWGREDMAGKTGLDSATYRVLSDASPTACPPSMTP